MIHLDAAFLIDLLREKGQGGGPATRLLDEFADQELWVSVHVVCELYAGVELSQRRDDESAGVTELLAGLQVAFPDPRFPPVYGRLLADLERRGERIGVMDLLIASAAVVAGAPLVTRNVQHFERITGLRVLGY